MAAGSRILRLVAAAVAFAAVAYVGVAIVGDFGGEAALATWALVGAIGLLVAFIAYAAVEYAQTRRLDSIASQFETRTIVLMPLAIAVNIVLGAVVANALKVPIYLDSIGTILVGALAGPIPGALTGFITNVLWTYVVPPPFQSSAAAAFAIVAAVIGLLAGAFGRVGAMRPRPHRSMGELLAAGAVAAAVIGLLAAYSYLRFYTDAFEVINTDADPVFVVLGWLVVGLALASVVALFALLLWRRDLTVAYVVVAGVVTGVIAALISAPISANLFSGVTGAGTDFLVAAFRQAGADIQAATLGQGLLSDPIDKVVTFFTVYLIVQAMSRRARARFPQGEQLIERGAAPAGATS